MKLKNFLLILCSMAMILGIVGTSGAQEESYNLVWSDEFNYTGLPDGSKWSYDVGGNGWGNNELQYYTENRTENARVENGRLIITAIKENYGGNGYTSARLISKNNGDWLYGKLEIKAKIPWGRGSWPAIWMLPTDWEYGGWPNSGEIDIMEHVGYDQGKVHATVHTGAYNHMNGTQKGNNVFSDSVSDSFHTYGIEWSPEKIDFFMDGDLYFTFNNEYKTFAEWPFDKRFHLLMNIAVGGDWGGAQGVDDTIWPQTLEVEYVRVYAQGGNDPGPTEEVPGQIEAEAFAAMNNVQTEECSEGGNNVGWIDTGDWIDYDVNVLRAGDYTVEYRVSGWNQAAGLQFQLDNQNLTSSSIPNTGGYQKWTTITNTVNLPAGVHTIRLYSTGTGWNINWFKLTAANDPDDPDGPVEPGDPGDPGDPDDPDGFTGYYTLTSLDSGKCLDVSGNSTANGANVKQWSYVGGQNQQWSIEEVSDGYYKIIARHSNKCLDVSDNSTANGANIHQWSYGGGQNQQWSIEEVSNGSYKITARNSGKCLDVEGFSIADGGNIHQWSYVGGQNQQWSIEKVDDGDDDGDDDNDNDNNDNFTFVVIPDTQVLSETEWGADMFRNATQWIVNQKDNLNVEFVSHLGDMTQWNDYWQWTRVESAMDTLRDNGLRYSPAQGNHDDIGELRNRFPVSDFSGKPWFESSFGGMENACYLFSAGGMDFVLVVIQSHDEFTDYYDWESINWANQKFAQYRNRRGIFVTHEFYQRDWLQNDVIKKNDNLFLAVCGHSSWNNGEDRWTVTTEGGSTVQCVMSDYQAWDQGGQGMLRYYTFKPQENRIHAYTYNPTTNSYGTQFNFDYDME